MISALISDTLCDIYAISVLSVHGANVGDT